MSQTGQIIKAVGGLYTVESPAGVSVCAARGRFRKDGISPCAGDVVTVTDGCIQSILPRKNVLIRPPLANLDCLFFVLSTCEPAPNLLLLDKFLAVCVQKDIAPALVFTKTDLDEAEPFFSLYRSSGFPLFAVDYARPETIQQVYDALAGRLSAFTGNSGVGKSTLLNAIDPRLQLETAAISQKLGRGRHTTRQVELFSLENGGKVADTPGFSTFETESYMRIRPQDLADCFPEFRAAIGHCRYADCKHFREPDCAVRAAVAAGEIPESRHASYLIMLEEAERQKEWEQKP